MHSLTPPFFRINVSSSKAFVNDIEVECLIGQNINENYVAEKGCRDIIIYNVVNNNIVKDFYIPYFSLLILLTILTIVLYESIALQSPVKPS